MKKKIVFLTGTRADFGKIKPLIEALHSRNDFEVHIFVTGMHMDNKYGYTVREIEKCGYPNIYKYINYSAEQFMDVSLATTIQGFSDYARMINPDLIIVHGDRVEALAGASVGAINNILVFINFCFFIYSITAPPVPPPEALGLTTSSVQE